VNQTEWVEPLEYAERLAGAPSFAVLYSGMPFHDGGAPHSYVCANPLEVIEGDDINVLAAKLSSAQAKFDNFWVGYLSYDIKNQLEGTPSDASAYVNLPLFRFIKYGLVAEFNHSDKQVRELYAGEVSAAVPAPVKSRVGGARVHSNMTDDEYLGRVEEIVHKIKAGELYQANLTRKFFGDSSEDDVDGFGLFKALCKASPAPYSAYIKHEDSHIISASPERFICMDAAGVARTTPIKGTAPRGVNEFEDEILKAALENSDKDRAENLMIVDLMRNDFARGAVAGSVKVGELFRLSTYATLHHLSSSVSALRRLEITPLQFVLNCFPAGSMTGAPKIRAMQVCSALEKQARGVYSGALGWFGGDGSLDLSVVIRTLVVKGRRFEYQAGGGIVADSVPHHELAELKTKLRALEAALGVSG